MIRNTNKDAISEDIVVYNTSNEFLVTIKQQFIDNELLNGKTIEMTEILP